MYFLTVTIENWCVAFLPPNPFQNGYLLLTLDFHNTFPFGSQYPKHLHQTKVPNIGRKVKGCVSGLDVCKRIFEEIKDSTYDK